MTVRANRARSDLSSLKGILQAGAPYTSARAVHTTRPRITASSGNAAGSDAGWSLTSRQPPPTSRTARFTTIPPPVRNAKICPSHRTVPERGPELRDQGALSKPRRRSEIGSTGSDGPCQQFPITCSIFSHKSSTSRSPRNHPALPVKRNPRRMPKWLLSREETVWPLATPPPHWPCLYRSGYRDGPMSGGTG